MALDREEMTTLLLDDVPLKSCMTSADAMKRIGALFDAFVNSRVPSGGAAPGTLTTSGGSSPMVIPGASFSNIIAGCSLKLTPAKSKSVFETQFRVGIGLATVTAKASGVTGASQISLSPTWGAQITWPGFTKTTQRRQALRTHIVNPVLTWLDLAMPSLAIPVSGPYGPGVFAGVLSGLSFQK